MRYRIQTQLISIYILGTDKKRTPIRIITCPPT